jgi:hypothetical protein
MGWASQTVASRHMSVGTAHLSEGGLSGMALRGTVVATNQTVAWAGEAVGQRVSGRRTPKAAHGLQRPLAGCTTGVILNVVPQRSRGAWGIWGRRLDKRGRGEGGVTGECAALGTGQMAVEDADGLG